ncbi:hypothetical protein D3C76_922670 [compost metagenome]
MILIMSTDAIGPIDAIATSPKLSSSDVFFPFTDAIPKPKANMKGTVIDPVVAPAASKDIPKKPDEVKIDSNNIIP